MNEEEEDDHHHPSTDEDEYKGARTSLPGKKGKTRASKPGATAPPPSKRIRKQKTASKPGKPAPAPTRRARKPKERKKEGGAVTSQGDVSAKDANVAKDNALFSMFFFRPLYSETFCSYFFLQMLW